MRSKEAIVMNFTLKYILKPIQTHMKIKPSSMRFVKKLIDMGSCIMAKVPDFISIKKVNAFGTSAEWIIPKDIADNNKVLLYMHGGGYFFSSPLSHRPITWRLSSKASVKVLSIDYRLLPDHTMCECWEDAIRSYKWLLDEGYKPENIVIAGDSAGAGLALSTLFQIKKSHLPQPAAAVCISPFADISGSSTTLKTNARNDHMFHVNAVHSLQAFLRESCDPKNAMISPVFGDYENLPPLFIQVSDTEMFYGDSISIREKAEKAGIEVKFSVWHNMPHVFTILANFVPESKEAISEIASFVMDKLKIN